MDMYDLLVVGLGIYGSAVAAEAAASGLKVLAVDQFVAPHDRGSSGGTSRIFRLTTLENDAYVARAKRALDLWKAYNERAGGELIVPMGIAIAIEEGAQSRVHHSVDQLALRAVRMARRHSIPHELLSGKEFRLRYPAFMIDSNDQVFYEPGAFILKPDVAITTMHARLAESGNGEIVCGVTVESVRSVSDVVEAVVDGRTIRARAAALCTGPWRTGRILQREVVTAVVRPQIVLRIPGTPGNIAPGAPALVHVSTSAPLTYIVPSAAGLEEVKIGMEQDRISVDRPDPKLVPANFIDEVVAEIRMSAARIAPGLDLVNGEANVCYYTVTPDSRHALQFADANRRILVVAACSGHGFKFAPAIAEEVVANLMAGDVRYARTAEGWKA